MRKNKKITHTKSSKEIVVQFEETYEGQMLLNSLSAAFYKVRKENQYIGETKIMQNLARKINQPQSMDKKTDQELERVINKPTPEKTTGMQEIILSQLYRNEGFIRTSQPKN